MSTYNVYSGRVVSGISLATKDMLFVLDGGTANQTTVEKGGKFNICSGGVANDTIVNSGAMTVSYGGTANDTTVNGGILYVSSGGTARNTIVGSGWLYIYIALSPETYLQFTFNNQLFEISNYLSGYDTEYGHIRFDVYSGGIAYNTTLRSDSFAPIIFSGGMASNTTIFSHNRMVVSSGGIARNTTTSNGGLLIVSSGGTAYETVIKKGEGLIISPGGVVNHTTIHSGGSFVISSGISVRDTTVKSNGVLIISSNGIADSTTVDYGGSMNVFSGGTATNVVWTPCEGHIDIENGAYVAFASKYSGVYYGSDAYLLSNSTVMNDMTVSSRCEICVMNDGRTKNIITAGGGSMTIYSGGIANNTIVSGYLDDTMMTVSSGGTANSTTIVKGNCTISFSGIANNTIVSSGPLTVSSGGTANSTTIVNGNCTISFGGIANCATVNPGGRLIVSSGGTATAIIENGGWVEIADSANVIFQSNTISGLILSNSYASATIHSGTTANDIRIDNGLMTVDSGGIANNTIVSGWGGKDGHLNVSSGGVVNGIMLEKNGKMNVSSGGTVNSVTLNNSVSSGVNIGDGAILNFATIDNGELVVKGEVNSASVNSSGFYNVKGKANWTTVNSGGSIILYSGGTANSATVKSGGNMYASGGGMLTGLITIENGATVLIREVVLDFNISELVPRDRVRVNNLSLIQGNPSFSLTVSGTQTDGTYNLAEGAAGFNQSITVMNTSGKELGNLTLGQTAKIRNTSYLLELNNDQLTVTLESTPDTTPPTVMNIKAGANRVPEGKRRRNRQRQRGRRIGPSQNRSRS